MKLQTLIQYRVGRKADLGGHKYPHSENKSAKTKSVGNYSAKKLAEKLMINFLCLFR